MNAVCEKCWGHCLINLLSETLTYSHVTEGKTSCTGIDLWVCVASILKTTLGNLQSEGHGIANLETMLSIGLGQEQQFSATSCILKRYTDLFYMNQSVIQTLSKDMD